MWNIFKDKASKYKTKVDAELEQALLKMKQDEAEKIRSMLPCLDRIVLKNSSFRSLADLSSKQHGPYHPAFSRAVYAANCPGQDGGLEKLQEAYAAIMAVTGDKAPHGGIKDLVIVD